MSLNAVKDSHLVGVEVTMACGHQFIRPVVQAPNQLGDYTLCDECEKDELWMARKRQVIGLHAVIMKTVIENYPIEDC